MANMGHRTNRLMQIEDTLRGVDNVKYMLYNLFNIVF